MKLPQLITFSLLVSSWGHAATYPVTFPHSPAAGWTVDWVSTDTGEVIHSQAWPEQGGVVTTPDVKKDVFAHARAPQVDREALPTVENCVGVQIRNQGWCKDGKAFLPIGMNRRQLYYPFTNRNQWTAETYMKELQKRGGNTFRVFSMPEFESPAGTYDDFALYAYDQMLTTADQLGINIIFSLIDLAAMYSDFSGDPYSVFNGGPFEKHQDIYGSEKGLELLKNRIQFLVEKLHHHKSIIAWEIGNEADIISEKSENGKKQTERVMLALARHIKEIDPSHKPVTASLLAEVVWPEVFASKDIDFIQYHSYATSNSEVLPGILRNDAEQSQKFGKHVLIGEYGAYRADPERNTFLKTGLWAAMSQGMSIFPWVSGSDAFGELFDEDLDLYAPLSKVASQINWTRPLKLRNFDFSAPGATVLASQLGNEEVLIYVHPQR